PSAPKCTANNAGWNDKAVKEIVRIPITVKHRGVDAVTIVRHVAVQHIPVLNFAFSDAATEAGLVMTVFTVALMFCAGKSLTRFCSGDFFTVFYACHLAVLGFLALWLV
ncbi:TraX family protein, partial [Escherichia coli]